MGQDEPPILDYGRPPERWGKVGQITAVVGRYAVVTMALIVASILPLVAHGTWYFWHNPTWVFSLGEGGTYIGPSGSPVLIGTGWTLFIGMSLIAVPTWAAFRWLTRLARRAGE